jgi:hypothetical protein
MTQRPHQGRILDGSAFEAPHLDYPNYHIHGGRATRSGAGSTEEERDPSTHFDQIWFDDREQRVAFGRLGSQERN